MRGGRLLLLVGVVLVVGALVVGAYLLFIKPALTPAPQEEEGTPIPTPLPEDEVRIVVAAQNIPRGMEITAEANAVIMQNWPKETAPPGVISQEEIVYGRIARIDIPLGMPVLENMLTGEAGDLAVLGSDVALQVPDGMVAYALPVGRYSSVAWALQPGDYVDVVISLLMVDLDEEFQTAEPNKAQHLTCDPECGEGWEGVMGRLEVLPNGWLVNVTPGMPTHGPRLVTQLTVQNVRVLRVGDWPGPEELAAAEAPPAGEEEPPPEEEVAPPPQPDVEPLTLIVTRQEAMVLDYVQVIGARINFVLRGAGDDQVLRTESVTLQYLMDRYNIGLPPKLPYGITPAASRLERIPRDESAAQYGSTDSGGE